MAVLTKSLTRLRTDFNTACPNRDKASDGWIGDAAHMTEKSGHNPESSGKSEYTDGDKIDEVRAIDVDDDLKTPGVTMLKVIQKILATPNDLKRLKYIIYNRVIWSKSNGWRPRAYTGSSPHTEHAHFSGDPAYDEDVTAWSVLTLEDNMPLTVDDIKALITYNLSPSGVKTTVGQALLDAHRLWQAWPAHEKECEAANARANGMLTMTDVITSWSDVSPTGVQNNALADAVNAIAAGGVDPVVFHQAIQAAIQAAVAAVLPAALEAALAGIELKIEKGD
jgi:hypothetical protein